MFLVLGGDSWADRSSYLAVIDLLRQVIFEDLVASVETVDLDDRNGYEILKESLKRAKVLVVCGGKPVALSKALSKKGITLISQWLFSSSQRNKYIGICGGAVFATSFLNIKGVEFINDECWRQCGLSGPVTVQVEACLDSFKGRVSDFKELEYQYECGPLMRPTLGLNPFYIIGIYASDIVADHRSKLEDVRKENFIRQIDEMEEFGRWLCQRCTYINHGQSRSKCFFCEESRANYRLPPVDQMPSSLAMVMTPLTLLYSVHPELSGSRAKHHFIGLVETFLSEE